MSGGGTSSTGWSTAAYDRFGKVDVLINNAGMSPLYESLSSVTEKLFDAVVNLNLKGPFRLSALVGERMVADGGGSIINVSSSGSRRPTAGAAAVFGRQGGAQRADRGARAGLRADRPGQHVDARSVPDRHQQGVGHTGDHDGRTGLRTQAARQSARDHRRRPVSGIRRVAAIQADRSSASTEESPKACRTNSGECSAPPFSGVVGSGRGCGVNVSSRVIRAGFTGTRRVLVSAVPSAGVGGPAPLLGGPGAW